MRLRYLNLWETLVPHDLRRAMWRRVLAFAGALLMLGALALAGADVCTLFYDVMRQLYDHPLTEMGIEQFLKDWKKVPD